MRRCHLEEGLTTLEWLLIVAAVAGLAALAVVLVQNVVGGTAESVASHSARQEAAELAASVLEDRWRAEVPDSQSDATEINRAYETKCLRLGIIYGDISLRPEAKHGALDSGGSGWDPNGLPQCQIGPEGLIKTLD